MSLHAILDDVADKLSQLNNRPLLQPPGFHQLVPLRRQHPLLQMAPIRQQYPKPFVAVALLLSIHQSDVRHLQHRLHIGPLRVAAAKHRDGAFGQINAHFWH